MSRVATDILIVGAGPAGLAAAAAASTNAQVTLIDENPRIGGQIWRAELGTNESPEALKLLNALDSDNVGILNSTTVFDALNSNTLATQTPSGRVEIEYQRLILATGARERFLPFPGWTFPGVFGAGGLQALVKGGLNIEGKSVIVAGTGPLLLAAADYLKMKGARVSLIAEQTSAAKIRRFARGLWRQPDKMMQAAALRARLIGISYKTDTWVTHCGSPRVSGPRVGSPHVSKGHVSSAQLSVTLISRGTSRTLECDLLACGFHLVPNLELPSLLGCEIDDGFVVVNDHQQTSIENIYCAGEPTGIAGVESSMIEGEIAGLAASGQAAKAASLFKRRDAARRFGEALNKTFALRPELKMLADDSTLVCRCEDVAYDDLKSFTTFREAKLQTRCGMGPCQGRVCGPAVEFLFGWEPVSVRPPLFPVKMEHL